MKLAGQSDKTFRVQAIAVVLLTIVAMIWIGGDDEAADVVAAPPAQPEAVTPGPAETPAQKPEPAPDPEEPKAASLAPDENGDDEKGSIYDSERSIELQSTIDRMIGLDDDEDAPEEKPEKPGDG